MIYVPTDNTAASNAEIISNICLPEKVPVIAGEEGICSGCGVATLSISYDLGIATGKMAVKILKGEADVAEMPVEYAPNFTKKYNPEICEELGIEIPDDYEAIECRVIKNGICTLLTTAIPYKIYDIRTIASGKGISFLTGCV